MTKGFFKRLVKMEANTRIALRAGRIRVWVDKEENGDFVVALPNATPARFAIAYDAAMHLRSFALADAAQVRHDNRFN
jgi:hypothetical protein